MRLRVRLNCPIAGEHGDHAADSLVNLPHHVARQFILNGHGELVDQAGESIPHDFEPDQVAEEILDADQLPPPAPTVPIALPTAKRKPGRGAKPIETAPVEAKATTEVDPGEWDSEE